MSNLMLYKTYSKCNNGFLIFYKVPSGKQADSIAKWLVQRSLQVGSLVSAEMSKLMSSQIT